MFRILTVRSKFKEDFSNATKENQENDDLILIQYYKAMWLTGSLRCPFWLKCCDPAFSLFNHTSI